MEYENPASWLWSSPALLAGIAVWIGGLLAIELAWYRRTGRSYDRREARRSLAAFAVVGIAQVVLSVALMPVLWLVWPYRFFTLSMDSAWHWLMAWIITDFAYYWIHRFLHSTRLGWSFHAPHYSVRQLSFLDGIRSSWGEQPMGVFAYGIPLVLLGVPPYIAGFFYLFVAVFQFAVHTEMSWSLGPLDSIVYTPAAHRSHHATERVEADRNYGGFFLLFDRIFGTWTKTDRTYRPHAYGLPTAQPTSLRGVLFGEMARLVAELRIQPGLLAKIRYALTRPTPVSKLTPGKSKGDSAGYALQGSHCDEEPSVREPPRERW